MEKKHLKSKVTLKMLEEKRDKLYSLLKPIEAEISKRTLIGYRGFWHGDEYNYGGYQNFLFSEYSRTEAKKKCEELVARAKEKNGGSMQELHRGDDLKYGQVS